MTGVLTAHIHCYSGESSADLTWGTKQKPLSLKKAAGEKEVCVFL